MLPLATILVTIQDLMGTWGYPVLFGLLFSCGLGVPLPEDIPLLLGGYFVANHRMNLALAALAAWCGIIGGDCMLYMFGRKFGMNITRIPIVGKEVTPQRIDWVNKHFHKYGIWFVGVGRMLAGVRGAMVVTAGITRFPFIPFIIADGLAAIVSGGLFMSLGYWAGRKLGDLNALAEEVRHYEREVTITVIAIAVVLILFLWYRHNKNKPPPPPTIAPEEEKEDIAPPT